MTFESHWASEHFEPYDPAVNGDELARALREHDRRSLGEASTISFANLDVRPYPHQQRMLEALDGRARAPRPPPQPRRRRDRHGQDRRRRARLPAARAAQLVATSRCCSSRIASEILRQSLATYRAVLRDGAVRRDPRRRPDRRRVGTSSRWSSRCTRTGWSRSPRTPSTSWSSTSSTTRRRRPTTGCSTTSHPTELLGLTATPERLDGKDVTEWFDHRIAVELRLWEAIDQGFLVPVPVLRRRRRHRPEPSSRGGAAATRSRSSATSSPTTTSGSRSCSRRIQRIVLDPGAMRALGFCVSKEHARFMARKFTEAGLASVALTGDDPPDVRAQRLRELEPGELRCVFSVEVLGEGVDVPDVDCVLLLRPTASATVFAQQLGRGLRRAAGKSHLTVIDLIGQHRREFRFEDRLRAILDRAPRTGRRPGPRRTSRSCRPAARSTSTARAARSSSTTCKAAVRRSRWQTLVSDLRARAGRHQTARRSSSAATTDSRTSTAAIAAGRELRRDAGHPTRRTDRRGTRSDGAAGRSAG